MLGGKNILVGITGGIAAYKTAFLVRLLKKAGANVKVVLTENASSFVSPLTLATLSENPVGIQFTEHTEEGELTWNNHVEMGLWADYMIIAPATANSLAKMASGQADNLLLVTYLSAKCPVLIAPAMDLDMYKHPTTKKNIDQLIENGHAIIPVGDGPLASGLSGEGRMAEPEDILEFLIEYHRKGLKLYNKKVLITAGPTYEAIDPVRYIGNHSSGTMGAELALRAARLGAEVVLVMGPSSVKTNHGAITRIDVTSAQEMQDKTEQHFKDADIVIGAAAVSDYRPKEVSDQKIKKQKEELRLELVKNPDILKGLGLNKKHQFLVGFALETQNALAYAQAKLKEKNLDAIVVNSLEDTGAGFGTTTNKVSFIDKNGKKLTFDVKPKEEVAVDIWNQIISSNE
jgi:phosphopantothenoylcysteine decarboxylase/phosphopantothenate--cysteine ligase